MEADSVTKIVELLFSRWLKIQDLHIHAHTAVTVIIKKDYVVSMVTVITGDSDDT
jgi:hypothetical protein